MLDPPPYCQILRRDPTSYWPVESYPGSYQLCAYIIIYIRENYKSLTYTFGHHPLCKKQRTGKERKWCIITKQEQPETVPSCGLCQNGHMNHTYFTMFSMVAASPLSNEYWTISSFWIYYSVFFLLFVVLALHLLILWRKLSFCYCLNSFLEEGLWCMRHGLYSFPSAAHQSCVINWWKRKKKKKFINMFVKNGRRRPLKKHMMLNSLLAFPPHIC